MTTKMVSMLDAYDLNARLRKACQDLGSQAAFARKVGVSPAFVHAVLNATKAPTPDMLRALGLRRIVRYVEVDRT